MGMPGTTSGLWRSVALTLAVLALALKVAIPPGMMAAHNASPIPLVICTGHGPLVIGDHGPSRAPTHKHADAPCAFAGAAAPVTPASFALTSQPIAFILDAFGGPRSPDLAPGRGLAAPPPQSHAPPIDSV